MKPGLVRSPLPSPGTRGREQAVASASDHELRQYPQGRCGVFGALAGQERRCGLVGGTGAGLQRPAGSRAISRAAGGQRESGGTAWVGSA
jgi:hypothetical protein